MRTRKAKKESARRAPPSVRARAIDLATVLPADPQKSRQMVQIVLEAFHKAKQARQKRKKVERRGAAFKIGQTRKGGSDSGSTFETPPMHSSADIFASLQTPAELFTILSTPKGAFDASSDNSPIDGTMRLQASR